MTYGLGRRSSSCARVPATAGSGAARRGGGGGGGLIARIRLVVPAGLKPGDCDPALSSPCTGRVPTRAAFQFSGLDGTEETFPVEYVMRMMADWSGGGCDPYIRIQNTGVSVLLQGFFNPPHDAARTTTVVTADRCNAVLGATDVAGVSLSAVEDMKAAAGVDRRPFQACLNVSCFVRLPRVQLAFRFMGPGDPVRTRRLLETASGAYEARMRQQRQQQAAEARRLSCHLQQQRQQQLQQRGAQDAARPPASGWAEWLPRGLRNALSAAPADPSSTSAPAGRMSSWPVVACVTFVASAVLWLAADRVKTALFSL